MVKAEAVRFGLWQRAPIAERLLQQDEGADDIGLHERGGPVDRAIDMAFRRQMQDDVGLEVGQRSLHRRRVGDIRPDESKARMVLHRRQRIEIARIGELVDDKDMMVGGGNGMPHEGGADEPCPARHQKTLRHQAPVPANAAVCRFSLREMRVQRRPTVNIPTGRPQPRPALPRGGAEPANRGQFMPGGLE